MGRKDYRQQPQRGPGPKARRQKDPKLPPALLLEASGVSKAAAAAGKQLSSRQKKRLQKRLGKVSTTGGDKPGKKAKPKTKIQTPLPAEQEAAESVEDLDELNEDDDDDDLDEAEDSSVQKSKKKLRLDLGDVGDADSDGGDDDEGEDGRTLLDAEDEDMLNDDFPIGEDDDDDVDDGEELMMMMAEDGEGKGDDGNGEAEDDGEGEGDEDNKMEPGEDKPAPADLSELDGRIDELLQALSTKAKDGKRKGAVNRSELVEKLCGLLCTRFSYNAFLMRKLLDLYPKDILDFLQSNEVDRPLTLRVNALKTRRKDLAQALISRGVNLDPFDKWSKVGLVVFDSQVPLGATPEYLAGHYMLQGAASMLPVMALDPKPQEKVLDLCAAPGGKTTYIAELMGNTGLVMANEANRERAKAVVGNSHRHGLNNIVVCVGDGREFARTMHNFDRVLVDAPCTGTGVIAKDPAVKANKEERDVLKCSHLQKQLLLAGIDAAKIGGTIVYCTCSVLVEENEAVVDYALRKRAVKIEDTGLPIGEAGFRAFQGRQFHPGLSLAKRITPHQHNMDGFFVARLVKRAAATAAKKTAAPTPSEAEAANGDQAAA